ncbi:sporulation initiation factor Spo0A C-terminal domain-containing protein [Schinkia azotoformans]|uniref:sporulation initiation factor Spo0A C-terminal domain-containing protein n=1 Tax=Schinkia azotoformans TaxID=1454 RepID=UPI002DBF6FEA|nr:sporulation initiation factor Spo0A C-terminal domain-containing protein [Schinkia azotoformans]MEC1714741.1 sporulation initiation factor Spo0A C-terminal domain-containing protein [Schinkia azotoformans]MEC1757503.1 sporulation initiation factor Spo0A C-terminal domain-containing protein [Schinkia azotoformans]
MENQVNIEMVLSGLRNEIRGLRHELGAVKDVLALQNRVIELDSRELTIEDSEEVQVQTVETLDEKLFLILLSLHIPASNLGFLYLREAIKFVYEDATRMSRITKMIYPTIAEKYDSTASRVERGIRHSIELAWHRSDDHSFVKLKKYFPERPTNSEFIAFVSEKLRFENQKKSA